MKKGEQRVNGKYGTVDWMRKLAAMTKPFPKGEAHHLAKLSTRAVRFIRQPETMPRMNAAAIARLFGISDGYVYQLRRGKRWKHLK